MSKAQDNTELSVREQRKKQLKKNQNKENVNKNTETKKLYDMIMDDYMK